MGLSLLVNGNVPAGLAGEFRLEATASSGNETVSTGTVSARSPSAADPAVGPAECSAPASS